MFRVSADDYVKIRGSEIMTMTICGLISGYKPNINIYHWLILHSLSEHPFVKSNLEDSIPLAQSPGFCSWTWRKNVLDENPGYSAMVIGARIFRNFYSPRWKLTETNKIRPQVKQQHGNNRDHLTWNLISFKAFPTNWHFTTFNLTIIIIKTTVTTLL